MKRLDSRLDRLERRALIGPGGHRVVVWTQASDGSDRFTSTQHPGVPLTAADLDELPTDDRPDAGISVIVVRYDAANRDACRSDTSPASSRGSKAPAQPVQSHPRRESP